MIYNNKNQTEDNRRYSQEIMLFICYKAMQKTLGILKYIKFYFLFMTII